MVSLSNQPKGLCIKVSSWSVREDAIGSIEIQTAAAAVFFYFLNKSLCEPVRVSVNMSASPEIL